MMDGMPPQFSFTVGIVVERRRSRSRWIDYTWQPAAVLPGGAGAAAWSVLSDDGEAATFYAGATQVELHRTESGNYQENLQSAAPSLWISLRPTGAEPPYELIAATADPAEGESFTQAGQDLVGAVPLPAALREVIRAFIATHPPRPHFIKRRRDEAPPDFANRTRLRAKGQGQ
jgi:hypothetical protein